MNSLRCTTLAFLAAALALLAACGQAPKTGNGDPPSGPAADDTLPPDRYPGYDGAAYATIDSAIPVVDASAAYASPPSVSAADAGSDAEAQDTTDASAGADGGETTCQWVRLFGPCPPPPGDGNQCVPALRGDAHWELVCHPTCAAGEVWDGTGCMPSF
jgi:hypothetical protein